MCQVLREWVEVELTYDNFRRLSDQEMADNIYQFLISRGYTITKEPSHSICLRGPWGALLTFVTLVYALIGIVFVIHWIAS